MGGTPLRGVPFGFPTHQKRGYSTNSPKKQDLLLVAEGSIQQPQSPVFFLFSVVSPAVTSFAARKTEEQQKRPTARGDWRAFALAFLGLVLGRRTAGLRPGHGTRATGARVVREPGDVL